MGRGGGREGRPNIFPLQNLPIWVPLVELRLEEKICNSCNEGANRDVDVASLLYVPLRVNFIAKTD
jgi:hypothetical protein